MSKRVEGCVTGFFVVGWGGSLLIAYSEPYQPPLHPHNVILPTAILPPDPATVLMTNVATKVIHLLTRVSFMTGGYGITDRLVLIPTEAATTALITTALDTAAFRERGLSAIEYSRNA